MDDLGYMGPSTDAPQGKAYLTQPHDIVTPCPVCQKQIVLELVSGQVYQILFHNDRHGSPCNGTSKRAALMKIPNLSEV